MAPTLDNQWIELFRAGDYGDKGSYSESKLDELVRNFDPSFHEPPIVVGHPENDAPAYGWVEALKRQGSVLLGKLKQVEPQFAQMVADGRFKKRSVALYDGAKGLMLRHVGFLGAAAPHVKGLADVKFHFEDGERKFVEISFDEESTVDENSLVKKVVDALKGLFAEQKQAAGDAKVFSEEDAGKLVAAATKKLSDEIAAVKKEFTEREQAAAAAEVKARAQAAITKLKAGGHYLNAFDKMGLGAIFDELAKSGETVEFGEGDGKKKLTPLEIAVAFFEALPKVVPQGEHFSGQAPQQRKGTQRVNTTANIAIDQASVEFDERVKKHASEKKLSYGDAYRDLVFSGEGPQAQATAGAV